MLNILNSQFTYYLHPHHKYLIHKQKTLDETKETKRGTECRALLKTYARYIKNNTADFRFFILFSVFFTIADKMEGGQF